MNDFEYESIRAVMESRGNCGGGLPGKTVAFIPAERADSVLALDERIEKLKAASPYIITGTIGLLSFLCGLAI